MRLPNKDVDLFYRLNWSLLYYTNQRCPVIRGLNAPNLKDQDLQKVSALHEKLYSHPEIIDSFVAENPFKFNKEEMGIIKSWKNSLTGEFFIVSHPKKYSVFLNHDEEPKAFGVMGLYEEIEDILGPHLPVLVNTTLLPFRGSLIYCGILWSSNITFGPGIRRSIKADYQKAKSRFGIITSLDTPVSEMEESDESLMKFYVKNATNREEYSIEIDKLLERKPSLWRVYYREIGRSNARRASKRFSEMDIEPRWFAIFEDVIIASGQSEKEVRAQVETILPGEQRDYAYIFKYAKKKGR